MVGVATVARICSYGQAILSGSPQQRNVMRGARWISELEHTLEEEGAAALHQLVWPQSEARRWNVLRGGLRASSSLQFEAKPSPLCPPPPGARADLQCDCRNHAHFTLTPQACTPPPPIAPKRPDQQKTWHWTPAIRHSRQPAFMEHLPSAAASAQHVPAPPGFTSAPQHSTRTTAPGGVYPTRQPRGCRVCEVHLSLASPSNPWAHKTLCERGRSAESPKPRPLGELLLRPPEH